MRLYEVILQFEPDSIEWRSTGRMFDDFERAKNYAKEMATPGIDALIVDRIGSQYARVSVKAADKSTT